MASDYHIIPSWEEHTPDGTCWCNPHRFSFDFDQWEYTYKHRPNDPDMEPEGREWLVVQAA